MYIKKWVVCPFFLFIKLLSLNYYLANFKTSIISFDNSGL